MYKRNTGKHKEMGRHFMDGQNQYHPTESILQIQHNLSQNCNFFTKIEKEIPQVHVKTPKPPDNQRNLEP